MKRMTLIHKFKILNISFLKCDILTIFLRISLKVLFTPNNKNDSKKVNGVSLVKIYNAAFNVSVD